MAKQTYLDLGGLTKYDELIKGLIGIDKIPSTATEKTVVEYLLAQVSDSEFSGKAEDVDLTAITGLTATDVQTAIEELLTSIKTLNGGATEAGSVAKAIADAMGELKIGSTTYTTAKAYMDALAVGIKNLIDASTGDISALTTDVTSDLVHAINDVNTKVKAVDYSGKADKVTSAVTGNFAGLDADGNLTDSGKKAADFEVAGAAAAVSGYGDGETAKTVKEVATEIGTKKVDGASPVAATGMYKYIDDAVAGVDSTTANAITISTTNTTSGMLKSYEIYQGGSDATNLIGTIDIPKDLVVSSGQVVKDPTGQAAGTYIELTIANQDDPLYINVKDLVDAYTAQTSATQVQLSISATNEISASIVAKSITSTELADSVNTDIAKGQSALDAIGTAKSGETAGTGLTGKIEVLEDSLGTGYSIGGNSATVKSYIDSRIFIGTQEEVTAAKTAKQIDDSTFIVVTDNDVDGIDAIAINDITALFA